MIHDSSDAKSSIAHTWCRIVSTCQALQGTLNCYDMDRDDVDHPTKDEMVTIMV